MPYQTGFTIKNTLDAVESRKLVLPAIQREFVWRHDQICRLFDSLLQGYPFGTFLYWKVLAENSAKYTYYDFVLDYHQRDQPDAPKRKPMPGELIAVLDGQQRLTALNIGFRGSMAWKLPRRHWRSLDAFPVRRLYLDLLWTSSDEDAAGNKYRFEFLTREAVSNNGDSACWFPVKDILDMPSFQDLMNWLVKHVDPKHMGHAANVLGRLHQVAHKDPVVAYYVEDNQELDRVLQIFIRMNSGGTSLSYSDLLLSVAVAQWSKYDAREEIRTLVREINSIGNGFAFSKDLVLKAGLMLSDIGSVGFKVSNFDRHNMAILEDNWDRIKQSLKLAVQLVSKFGFSGRTLRADSAILPIAYYVHARKRDDGFLTSQCRAEDREAIRQWLVRSILKASGIWGSGLDTLLTALRDVIRESNGPFPVTKIKRVMAQRGRSLIFESEEIDDLADIQYGDSRTFALLSLLFDFVNVDKHHFHIDHVFPQARFRPDQLRRANVPDAEHDDFRRSFNRLANLQLLDGLANERKAAELPSEWMRTKNPNERRRYCRDHMLGDLPEQLSDFMSFYDTRREALRKKIVSLLGVRARDDD